MKLLDPDGSDATRAPIVVDDDVVGGDAVTVEAARPDGEDAERAVPLVEELAREVAAHALRVQQAVGERLSVDEHLVARPDGGEA
jgi:hypothetical protein